MRIPDGTAAVSTLQFVFVGESWSLGKPEKAECEFRREHLQECKSEDLLVHKCSVHLFVLGPIPQEYGCGSLLSYCCGFFVAVVFARNTNKCIEKYNEKYDEKYYVRCNKQCSMRYYMRCNKKCKRRYYEKYYVRCKKRFDYLLIWRGCLYGNQKEER